MIPRFNNVNNVVKCCAIGAFAGALGGASLKTFIGTVSIIGHTSFLGLFPLATYGVYSVLEAQKVSTIARHAFAILGGYLAAYIVPNCFGFSVSLPGPLLGVGCAALFATPIAALFAGIYFLARAVIHD